MAQKANKKNQGKPVYKPRQPAAQPATEASAAATSSSDGQLKGEKVNWTAVMNNASTTQQAKAAAAKPVDFQQIHKTGSNPATMPAFQSSNADAPDTSTSSNTGRDSGRPYHGKNPNYQPRNNQGGARHGGGQGQGQGHPKGNNNNYGSSGGGGHAHPHNNNQNRGGQNQARQNYQNQGYYNNPHALIGGMTPQMLSTQAPQLLSHTENMQKMEFSEIESLFTSICSQIDPELLQATLQQAGMNMHGRPGGPPNAQMNKQRGAKGDQKPYSAQNQNYQQRPDSNYGGGRGGKRNQPYGNQRHAMPMPGAGGNKAHYSKLDSSEFPSLGAAGGNQQTGKMVYQAKKPARKQSDVDSGEMPAASSDAMASQGVDLKGGQNSQGGQQMPFFTNAVQMNLCQEHFPEPIMMFKEKPLCKKCIQQQFQAQQAQFKMSHTSQAMNSAKLLGLNHRHLNEYQSEKQKITRSIQRLDNFKKQFRYIEDDIKQREQMSAEHMRILTPLMNSMFDKLEELQIQGEQKFKNKIFQIVRNQQKNIQDDMKIKLPQFYNRLQQKYNQLQQASNLAQQRGAQELIETLKHYQSIFVELDSEYEKYFNDYEKMSKLQRLLDKDANEIVRDFTDVVERNLRVDYNIKSSFGPQLPQRLHSFQWNQKCVQLFRLKTNMFEKKPVQMTYDVPLYSRSIATETGTIYLTGGYVKHMGVYLKNCYRYDDLFGILNQVSHMNYPHADHSICTIQNFIYVIGTFVGNQVYGYCEVYDTQKDKWKLIADMRVPRTGTSLCVFKNNYIFAFGGRVDQKRIVDTIECYDISRNVWQEICAPKVNKSHWVPSYMGLAHQITDNEILLFGGKSAATFHIFNGCFVFDVEKMEIRERGSLVNPCSFMNTSLVFNQNLYAYGNDIYVHQYNIPEQKWSVIPKSGVVLPKA